MNVICPNCAQQVAVELDRNHCEDCDKNLRTLCLQKLEEVQTTVNALNKMAAELRAFLLWEKS